MPTLMMAFNEVHNLMKVFQSFHKILPEFQTNQLEAHALLSCCLQSSERQVLKLESKLNNLMGPSKPVGSNVKGKLKEVARTMKYPFQQGKLRDLRDAAGNILQRLGLVIQLANLNLEIAQTSSLDSMQNMVKIVEANTSQQNVLLGNLDKTVGSNTTVLQNNSSALQDNTSTLQNITSGLEDNTSSVQHHTTSVEANTEEARLMGIAFTSNASNIGGLASLWRVGWTGYSLVLQPSCLRPKCHRASTKH
ncbi:hypothetical protein QBC35DRAFT_301901 [Podospora australis]|uniref:Uncharacterized protein n=1 Tax=Podospora australis TaxID=1536484 RepID=A0AAN6WNM3_9PEZI|nr:hypothetical protein QBC35DRAFT_301901 [Podospora australis]